MDNLFSKGVITDAIMYLEGIPDKYIRNKSKIIDQLKERQQLIGGGELPPSRAWR